MRRLKISIFTILSCLLLVALPGSATQLTVSSYSMYNGATGSSTIGISHTFGATVFAT